MKKMGLLLLLSLALATHGGAQQPPAKWLTSYHWLLTADEMSGVGTHHALPKDIQLSFGANGQWTATHPLLNKQAKGTWETDKKGKLVLKAGSKTADLVLVTQDKLQIVYEQMASKVTLTWEPAK